MQRRYRKSSISQSTRPTPKGEKDKEPAHNTFADYLFNIMYRRTNARIYMMMATNNKKKKKKKLKINFLKTKRASSVTIGL
jgi:hypothetical protein